LRFTEEPCPWGVRYECFTPPELENFVAEKVKTGMYQTASEVVREGLRLLKERDEGLAQLRARVRAGSDAIDRGEYQDYDEHTTTNLAADIKKSGRRRLAEVNKKTGTR
jgi:antitoxin ParD1/3/4